jgi:hypothetical protein
MTQKAPSLEEQAKNLFKSEGERQIARLFDACGIPYRYEYPLAVVDRGKVRIGYPDFWLPEYGVYVECVGMRGDSTYNRQLEHKKAVYGELRLPVIFIGPESFRGFWPRRVLKSIEQLLGERAEAIRERASQVSSSPTSSYGERQRISPGPATRAQ